MILKVNQQVHQIKHRENEKEACLANVSQTQEHEKSLQVQYLSDKSSEFLTCLKFKEYHHPNQYKVGNKLTLTRIQSFELV